MYYYLFFFNDTATTEIYTLSLHDALPISRRRGTRRRAARVPRPARRTRWSRGPAGERCRPLADVDPRRECRSGDRKSTRLNSSHANISYAVFCLKKKKPLNSSNAINTYTV